MPQPAANQRPNYFLRRVPRSYRKGSGALKDGAFNGTEGRRLSLFDPMISCPRLVLKEELDRCLRLAPTGHEAAAKSLARYGLTVEEWVANNCTVALVPLTVLTRCDFDLNLQDLEANGHFNAVGDCNMYKDDVCAASFALPPEECLLSHEEWDPWKHCFPPPDPTA